MTSSIPSSLEPVLKSRYPHRPRVLFVLRRRPGASPEAFEQALGDWRRRWEFGVAPGTIIARAGVAIAEMQDDLDKQFQASGAEVTAIDGYVSLDLEIFDPTPADFETLFKAAAGCLEPLIDVVDLAESVTLAGVANLTIPGFAPTSMILILDRVPELSVEQYNEWWVRHGDDHRRANPAQVGYHQLHIAPEFNALVADSTGTAVTGQCVIDIMYLGHTRDGFPAAADPSSGDARVLADDIGAHVSFASVKGSFIREI
ncbi:hypothetical protein OG225_17720 [Nocardia sp. NBC_01377]|uniref:hypothetical protein n=1 Tax=Nocardia sp. NBC_01377 TaxID=2903595 RepID=UPI003249CE02